MARVSNTLTASTSPALAGKVGDGGKWICDAHRIREQEECLVYSIGSNNDFSFEASVLKDIGQHCEIHTVS